ncbi:GNAT family N-acetyltransferase [Saccharospirillum impatiens]|uniref:GNAT family N-acetyltransferase n=1 Tax=Saccharospirillum impatiens TaxID=169438 RepID=UPI00040D74D5|nr:GNAT family N-acetyltransferase [Saccharospirillum impatiens]
MSPITTASGAIIRLARPDDVTHILRFINELADYEKLAHEVVATEEKLTETLFSGKPAAEVLIAERDGKPVGMALFFSNYSTFLAQPGIHLEDLYVQPDQRGSGVGKALITSLAQLAVERDCGRLEWNVLDWNEPARQFYRSLGASALEGWITKRVTGESLQAMARMLERAG